MQNNDFDRFIQQSLENQPEPEYNPADWDKLEDRLHNLHANQPSVADKVVSGGSSLGKLGFAATAMLVTALNVLIFTQPEIFKTATDKVAAVKSDVLSEPETNLTSLPAAPVTTAVVNPDVQVATPETEISGEDENDNTITNTIIESLPAVTPQEPAVAAKAVIKPAVNAASVNRSQKATRNTSKPAASFTWSPSAAGRPGTTAGAGLLGGKPGAAVITPCGITKPELAATLIGNDTLRGSKIGISTCQQLKAKFFAKDTRNGNLTITSNLAKTLPGAKLVTDGATGITELQWQPKPEMARQQPYTFTIWVTDSRCPDEAIRAYQFALSVTPAFTAAIEGNTKLEAGETTTLQVSGAPAGATYQWLVGKEVVANRESNQLAVMPLKTTTYRLAVTSAAGCTYSDSVRIEVSARKTLVTEQKSIPNIFTPNGDGINDYFKVILPEDGAFDLVIFDRWGKQVYSRKNYDNRWNGANLDNGTYYYIITTQETKKTYKGWVEVLR